MAKYMVEIDDYATDTFERLIDISPWARITCVKDEQDKGISREVLGKAIKSVQNMFWAQSSYAVIFCAARDYFGYDDNASFFESEITALSKKMKFDYPCPPNTIATSFYNNDYMKYPVAKWEAHHVKTRSINLVKAFIGVVKMLLEEENL